MKTRVFQATLIGVAIGIVLTLAIHATVRMVTFWMGV